MPRDQHGNFLPEDLVELLDVDEFDESEINEDDISNILSIPWYVATFDGIDMGIFVSLEDLLNIGIEEYGESPLEAGVGPMAFWKSVPIESHCWDEENSWHTH